MRLKYHLFEGRSKTISDEVLIDHVRNKCKDSVKAYNKGDILYRGIHTNEKFLYIEPKKHVRVSANTLNLYTLVMDNSPKWKAYPKRSQSIICTNDEYNASGYGHAFVVFPTDGANYGVCPEADLWMSFYPTLGGITLDMFNDDIIFGLAKNVLDVEDVASFKTFKDLVSLFDEMDKQMLKKKVVVSSIIFTYPWMKYYDGSFLRLMSTIFDPKTNKFKQTNKPPKIYKGDEREIWTDQPSYMVTKNWLDNNYRELTQ